jgi:transcriptional regulator with XRE-family HTH domain
MFGSTENAERFLRQYIEQRREAMRMSRRELGDLSGCSEPVVWQIERGNWPLHRSSVKQVLRALSIQNAELMSAFAISEAKQLTDLRALYEQLSHIFAPAKSA